MSNHSICFGFCGCSTQAQQNAPVTCNHIINAHRRLAITQQIIQVLCRIGQTARVIGPDAAETTLVLDPLTGTRGCAAYWPADAGIYRIVQPGPDGLKEFAFTVLPEAALAASHARAVGEATVRWVAEQSAASARGLPDRRGAAWPYFIGWLLLTGLLWLGERRWLSRAASAD